MKFLHKLLNHHGLVLPVPLRNNETEIGEIAMEQMELKKLQILSAKIRIDILEMLVHCGQGHLGGAMSLVETMAVLYGKQLHVDPKIRN